MRNEGPNAPTPTDLSGDFPVHGMTVVLTLTLVAVPNSSGRSIGVRTVEEVSGAVAEVTVNTEIPAAAEFPNLRNAMNYGGTAAPVAFDCSGRPHSTSSRTRIHSSAE